MTLNLKQIFGLALLALFVGLLVAAMTYRDAYHAASEKAAILQHDIDQQAKAAEARLKQLTIERDAKQAKLDKQAKEQEKTDEQAKSEIARLGNELTQRPVRVRITSTRHDSGSTTSNSTTAVQAGAGNEAEAYGILPAENTKRLADALMEVETLSAAYNSCRSREIPE